MLDKSSVSGLNKKSKKTGLKVMTTENDRNSTFNTEN